MQGFGGPVLPAPRLARAAAVLALCAALGGCTAAANIAATLISSADAVGTAVKAAMKTGDEDRPADSEGDDE